jgi:hypothetical protein
MKRNDRSARDFSFSGLLPGILFFVLYVAVVWFLIKPLMAFVYLGKADEKGLISALKYDEGNASYHYLLGRYYNVDMQNNDIDRAIFHYRRSIALNPLQAGAWSELSKIYLMSGKNNEAEYVIERAVRLKPNDPGLMWEAGTFWLINNMTDRAVPVLRRYINSEPENQAEVYDICWKLGLDNSYILQNLVPPQYRFQAGYLNYLIATKRAAQAHEVWTVLDKNSLEQKLFIDYVNFLVENRLYAPAQEVWKDITGRIEKLEKNDDSSIIWNAGFEREMLNGGFDWVIGEAKGVDIFLDDGIHMTGSRSLGVKFDGTENPDITIVQQVVRVSPGAGYTLKGYIRSDALTTTNGLFMSVDGHKCTGLNRRSDIVTGTSFWKEVSVDFETPSDCGAVVIRIRRERSAKLDNKITGEAWIDGISLKLQTEIQKSSSRRP